ncbi:MAG: cob(I)yrinic acid a,c-diamide adenosyltransferase [Chloroflexota bacterium]|nr:cob(I)yrinic acid a,c-diamide adenosyltransferase [Chloroflexota bacterium]
MVARRPAIAKSAVATGKGDDGTTGLLYGGRIAKDDPRTEAYGTVDEAVAALGLARAELNESGLDELAESVLRWQRELFVVGADLATAPEKRERLEDGVTRVSETMLDGVEVELALWESAIEMPREFIVPGETVASAALEMARVILRRAERRAIAADHASSLGSAWIVPYLNRLADLLWVLARAAEQAAGAPATTARVR